MVFVVGMALVSAGTYGWIHFQNKTIQNFLTLQERNLKTLSSATDFPTYRLEIDRLSHSMRKLRYTYVAYMIFSMAWTFLSSWLFGKFVRQLEGECAKKNTEIQKRDLAIRKKDAEIIRLQFQIARMAMLQEPQPRKDGPSSVAPLVLNKFVVRQNPLA